MPVVDDGRGRSGARTRTTALPRSGRIRARSRAEFSISPLAPMTARSKNILTFAQRVRLPPPRPPPQAGEGAPAQRVRLFDSGRLPGFGRQLEDVHPGVCAIDQVDIAAVVGLHVVALDRDLAAVLAVDLDA